VQEQGRDSRHPIDARCNLLRFWVVSTVGLFDPGFDIDLCERGFGRYQSLCNMQYDRGRFGFWNGRRW